MDGRLDPVEPLRFRHVVEVGVGRRRFDLHVEGILLWRRPVKAARGRRCGGRVWGRGRRLAGRDRTGRRSRCGVNGGNRTRGRPRGRWRLSWPDRRAGREASRSWRRRWGLGGWRGRGGGLGGFGRRLWRRGGPGLTLGLLNTFEQRQAVPYPQFVRIGELRPMLRRDPYGPDCAGVTGRWHRCHR
jgi:hypothetical protein